MRTATWATRVSNIACRMQGIRSQDRLMSMKAGREVSHNLYVDSKHSVAGTTYTTIADVIKGGAEHRIKFIRNGQTRYFEIVGEVDFDERNRLTRLNLLERDSGWIQEA